MEGVCVTGGGGGGHGQINPWSWLAIASPHARTQQAARTALKAQSMLSKITAPLVEKFCWHCSVESTEAFKTPRGSGEKERSNKF